jgi:hypothetical protein
MSMNKSFGVATMVVRVVRRLWLPLLLLLLLSSVMHHCLGSAPVKPAEPPPEHKGICTDWKQCGDPGSPVDAGSD